MNTHLAPLKGLHVAWIIGFSIGGYPIWCLTDVAGNPRKVLNADGLHVVEIITNDLNVTSRV